MTSIMLCDGAVELRLGDWRSALANVSHVDACVTDPPYSARVHDGASARDAAGTVVGVADYQAWSTQDVLDFVSAWCGGDVPRLTGWMVIHTDHETFSNIDAMATFWGRMTFAPVPVLQHMPRVSGDGPGSPGHFLHVSRPRAKRFLSWGSLPCWYTAEREKGGAVRGAKPLGLMRAIVRDYTRLGDLVVDPFCGGGTTALACAIEGRRCITSECDPETFEKARKRLAAFTPDMFAGREPKPRRAKQTLMEGV